MGKFQNIIEKLIQKLEMNLPGVKIQKKMAPELRTIPNALENSDLEYKNSGVLILLYQKSGQIFTCFIKRQVYDGPHSGQVSFPGGKFEKKDGNLIQTALREANEEIGVHAENIEVIGLLTPLAIPVSGMKVQPVVAYMNTKPVFVIDTNEVNYVIEVNIKDLLNVANHKIMKMDTRIGNINAPYYHVKNEKIWGATAMILAEFLEIYQKAIEM